MGVSGHGRVSRWWAVAVVIVLAAAACGDDGGESGGGPGSRPSGEPVVIGFVNLEGAPRGSAPGFRIGSEAAVRYINAELDGLGGRPLELEVCITNGSPESSAACANRMVERGAVAVLAGVDVGTAASLPILSAAGIPYLGAAPLLPADFTTSGAFMFDPGGLANAASAAYAVDELGADRVAVLHADDPPGKQLTEAFVRPVLLSRGVAAENVELVAEKLDAADLSPAVAAAAQDDPDAIIVVFPPPACSRIMQAIGTLDVDAAVFYIARCGSPSVLAAGGSGAEGAYFYSAILHAEASADHADVALYSEKIEEYGEPDVDPASFEIGRGFATAMTVHQRLATLDPDDITSSSVMASFRAAVDAPAFMSHPYTCDGQQAIPEFVTLCDTHVRIYQFVDGGYRDVLGEWISAAAALPG